MGLGGIGKEECVSSELSTCFAGTSQTRTPSAQACYPSAGEQCDSRMCIRVAYQTSSFSSCISHGGWEEDEHLG